MTKTLLIALSLAVAGMSAQAQNAGPGGISSDMLKRLQSTYKNTGADKAVRNALAVNDIDRLAQSAENKNNLNTDFSNKVKSKGITNQLSSGRCWLFTGLNVLRAQMMNNNDLAELTLSQNYNFFFDQLEKCNLFLQGIIDTSKKPMDDKMVEWLFKNPLSDGGQYTGISEIITKYGVVPSGVMKETYASNHTSKISGLLKKKLREYGLELRRMAADGKKTQALEQRKEAMLADIYRMLALTLGEPPTEFTWTRRDSKGNIVDTRTYTPRQFYKEYAGNDLKNDYVMLMNDPTREYYKLYEIDYDRHNYDGKNWTYVNLPVEDIKEIAISSIKDNNMMYFSCDVGKFLDRENGLLDPNNFDYESLFGVEFPMNKADRIRTFDSGSTHAMTLMAVDLDKNGKPVKWMVENSWGPGANNGHLIMTDEWFDNYMFRLVANKKYVPAKVLDILKQKPITLPAWDPMFADEL